MALPHVVLACINPDRVVYDAVENRVGDDVAAELSVPFLGRQLRGERRADGVDWQQRVGRFLRGRVPVR